MWLASHDSFSVIVNVACANDDSFSVPGYFCWLPWAAHPRDVTVNTAAGRYVVGSQ